MEPYILWLLFIAVLVFSPAIALGSISAHGTYTAKKCLKKEGARWGSLSVGAKKMLGVIDPLSPSGYYDGMEDKSVKKLIFAPGFYRHGELTNMVYEDANRIEKVEDGELSSSSGEAKTGLYPKRIEGMLRNSPHYDEITDDEWMEISDQYERLLDRELKKRRDKKEIAQKERDDVANKAQRIAQIPQKAVRKRSYAEEAQKEITDDVPDVKWDWDEEFAKINGT